MVTVTRIQRWARANALALLVMGIAATGGEAQGWIEPGVDRTGFAVDKVRSEVTVRVMGRVAEIEVSEWFLNDGPRMAEGQYLYPLAGEAVFEGFSLYQGETELRGEIMDADRAREIYEGIVRRRADPALIELAGQGLVRARVFPILPGETRKVSLRYTQLLERAGNALQLQYAGGVRGGAQATAGDVRRAVPEQVETTFRITVEDCDGFLDPFSPTHSLDFDRAGDRMVVSVEEEVVGRLSIFLPLAGDAVGMSVATHRPVGDDGYFMLTVSPDRDRGEIQPRDLTVVMDVSGSMSGEKIEQARDALHRLLATLSPEDRFRLLSFSSAVRVHERGWSEAHPRNLEDARRWVDRLQADGGTNIEGALTEAFRLESPADRLPMVVFLTDGLPSVGMESPEELARLAETRSGRARIFAFGVGYDVNTQLLDRIGSAGRGDTDYVAPGENVERALSLLATKIRYPVLTDLSVEGGPVDLTEIYPVRIPDVFAGQELVLFGRFEGDGQGQVTVYGERMGSELEFSTEVLFPEATDANDYLPRLWASRKLGYLERQVWTEGLTDELAEEIRTLALRYGLPSEYTAYLVQEPEMTAQDAPADNMLQRFNRGLRSAIGGQGSASSAPATAPTSGANAVQAASTARRMRKMESSSDLAAAEEERMDEVLSDMDDSVQRVAIAGRIFELRDDVWVDTSHREAAEAIEIVAFSAAWFDLLEVLPEIEAVLRAHENVVVGGVERSLKVGTEGAETLSAQELQEVVRDFRGAPTGAR
jgi:Ca-activated chloride channel family protein